MTSATLLTFLSMALLISAYETGPDVTFTSDTITVDHSISSVTAEADIQIYWSDCVTDLGESEILSIVGDPIIVPSVSIEYTIEVDDTGLTESDIVRFGIDNAGSVSFCTRVFTAGPGSPSVRRIFNATFNTSDGFALESVSNDPDDVQEVDGLNFQYSVFACPCDESLECVVQDYNQTRGAPKLRICLTPGDDHSLSNLNLSLSSSNGNVYQPVEFGSDGPLYAGDVTSIVEHDTMTVVVTRLVEDLFSEDDTIVSVSGMCVLEAGAGAKKADLAPFETTITLLGVKDDEEEPGCLKQLMQKYF